jgi:hypothetical protein
MRLQWGQAKAERAAYMHLKVVELTAAIYMLHVGSKKSDKN